MEGWWHCTGSCALGHWGPGARMSQPGLGSTPTSPCLAGRGVVGQLWMPELHHVAGS